MELFYQGWAHNIDKLKQMNAEQLFEEWLERDMAATFDEFVQAVAEYDYNKERFNSATITRSYGVYVLPPMPSLPSLDLRG